MTWPPSTENPVGSCTNDAGELMRDESLMTAFRVGESRGATVGSKLTILTGTRAASFDGLVDGARRTPFAFYTRKSSSQM